jgi:outer membrane protein OmpA-like peptidoglycan-associated protein
LAKDTKIPLSVPPFELNKSKLRFGADYALETIKSTLFHNPNVKFEIICFPDNDDNPAENETITRERAKAIEKYFLTQGIDASRITTGGSKKTDPDNPPPKKMKAKGKRYIGTTYIKITEV